MKQSVSINIFNELVKNLKRDSHDTDLQSIGFKSKYSNYELYFYAEEENNHELVLSDFDYSQGVRFYECFLNEEQITKLQCIIDVEVLVILDNIKSENSEGFSDDYESTGHTQSDFY